MGDSILRTLGQFFLKYVVTHPVVTAVRAGTITATHVLDYIGGGICRLANEATRKRIAVLADSWPQGLCGGCRQR